MAHFAPVRGDHIGRHRQPGGPTELGHDFAAREALFRAAGIFRIGQDIPLPFAQANRFIQQPCTVGIDGDPRIREALFQRPGRFNLLLAGQHAALQLEILKAVAILRRLGQPHHRVAGERFLVAQLIPVVFAPGASQIGEIGFIAIANVEQIAQHGDRIALFAGPQQLADRDIERLTQ